VLHVENLQREDVHPLDEAISYKELLKNGGYDLATLSAKIGKSEGYLHQRLKLNDLIKEAQMLFADDKIGFGHAVIPARLDKKQQKDILLNHLFSYRNEPVSVRELSDYVRRFLYLDLGNVPWLLDDAELLATAGACALCPKRTGSNPSLFSDMEKNTCTDRACFEKKMQAYLQKQIDSRPGLLTFSDYSANHKKDSSILTGASCRRIWGREYKCESAEEAIMVDGSDRGKTVFVCRNRECVKHRLDARQGARSSADRRKHRVEKTFRERLFATIREKVNTLPGDKVTRLVAQAMWRRLGSDAKRALLKAAGQDVPRDSVEQFGDRVIEKGAPVELGRMLVCMSVADELMVLTYQSSKPETMLKLADRYGIDVKAIRNELSSETNSRSKTDRNRGKDRTAA